VVVRTPLAFGFLTGSVRPGEAFAADDHRRRFSPEQRERWRQGGEVYRAILKNGGGTDGQNALRFCLAFPAVSTVIPGMLTAAHVRENAAAGDLAPLSDEARAACLQTGREYGFS
jgi:aryl-alcohol dehydrogenase-like predicted oxidoreductase